MHHLADLLTDYFFLQRKRPDSKAPNWAALNIICTSLHAVKTPDVSVCGGQESSVAAAPGPLSDCGGRAAPGQWQALQPELGLGLAACVRACCLGAAAAASDAFSGFSNWGLARAAFLLTQEDPLQPPSPSVRLVKRLQTNWPVPRL